MFVITLFHNLPYILGTELGLGVREGSFIVSYMLWFRLSSLLLSRQKFLLFIYLFYCVCRACLFLVRTQLFYLKFFKGLNCLCFGKIDLLVSIFFKKILLLPIGNFCCWANILGLYIYIFLDFRSINFLMDFKRRKY